MRKNKSFLLASFMTVLLVVADIMDKGLYITFNGIQYLIFDGENLPLPDSYEVNLEDKEADSGGETEAGTIQRDVVRAGVVTIAVTFSVTQAWLTALTGYKNQESIEVKYFDSDTAMQVQTQMYVEGLSDEEQQNVYCPFNR